MPSYVVQAGCITYTPGYPSAAAFPGLGVKVSKGAIFYHGVNLENKPWYNLQVSLIGVSGAMLA